MSMKYYVDPDGNLYAYEADGSQDEYIISGLAMVEGDELQRILDEKAKAQEPSPEQLRRSVMQRRDELLLSAGLRIAPLQDAIDLGKDTAGTKEELKLWKQYRIDVDRVSREYDPLKSIKWPELPAE